MKTIIAIIACIALATPGAVAQSQKPRESGFNKAFERLLTDCPQSFKNVRGDLILEDEDEQRYISNVELPGAEDCLISLPISGEKRQAKWEAIFFSSLKFEEAALQYKKLHQQLLGMDLRLKSKTTVKLRGAYITPDADEAFTTTVYSISPVISAYRRVRVELEIVNLLDEWRVNIRIGSDGFTE